MFPQIPQGYLSTLEEIEIEQKKGAVRSIWPRSWVDMTGKYPERRKGAPPGAFILPVQVLGASGVPRAGFNLRTATTKGASLELIKPDVDNPAFVNRWLRVEHSINDVLLISSVAPVVFDGASTRDTLVCWFFYPDPNYPQMLEEYYSHSPRRRR